MLCHGLNQLRHELRCTDEELYHSLTTANTMASVNTCQVILICGSSEKFFIMTLVRGPRVLGLIQPIAPHLWLSRTTRHPPPAQGLLFPSLDLRKLLLRNTFWSMVANSVQEQPSIVDHSVQDGSEELSRTPPAAPA